jgi:hypothetical protein
VENAFVTKVSNSATEEGNVVQRCEMVFDIVTIEYQDNKTGALGSPRHSAGTSRSARPPRPPEPAGAYVRTERRSP